MDNIYTKYVIKNTNTNEFMVCYRECLTDGLATGRLYKTFEEAYKVAKIYGSGREPIDETRHH